MPIQGTAINYWDKYAFIVKIDGVIRAAFNKCSGLKAEAEVIEYSEGGALTPHKQPGTIKFDDIELERGMTDDDDLYNWWNEIYNHASGTGSADERKYKRKVTIIQKDRSGAELTRWVIPKAFPAAFETDDWDNESSEHQITKLTLAHEGFEKE